MSRLDIQLRAPAHGPVRAAVRRAAVFNPVTVRAEIFLLGIAEIMLCWKIGKLPVVRKGEMSVGIITHPDLLCEFVARDKTGV